VNAVDAVIVVLLALYCIRGFVRGVFREAMGFVGLFGAGVAAMTYWRPVAELLRSVADLGPVAAQVAAGAVVFVAVNLLVHGVALLLDRAARAIFLGSIARVTGGALALGKGAIVVGLVLLLVRTYAPSATVADAIDHSTLGAPLTDAAGRLVRAGTDALQRHDARKAQRHP
jgi:membrane protein required for colicin V production